MSTSSFRDPLPCPAVQVEGVAEEELGRLHASGRLFAVLDACNQPAVAGMADVHPTSVSLFSGNAADELSAIAPYLFQVDAAWLKWFDEQLRDQPCGIFLASDEDLTGLRKHLRNLLKVRVDDRKELYFRFYDPRVFPGFLQTASATLAEKCLGPVDQVFWFDPAPPHALNALQLLSAQRQPVHWSVGERVLVTEQHIDAMDRFSKQAFAGRLEQYLDDQLRLAGTPLPRETIVQRVTWGLQNCDRYCIHRERHIATYLECVCRAFPDQTSEKDPESVQQLLLDRRLDLDRRLAMLEEKLGGASAPIQLLKETKGGGA